MTRPQLPQLPALLGPQEKALEAATTAEHQETEPQRAAPCTPQGHRILLAVRERQGPRVRLKTLALAAPSIQHRHANGLGTVVRLAAGQYHTCALNDVGTVTCSGDDSNGQIDVPGGLIAVTQITSGDSHTCAVHNAGAVSCWGVNNRGQANVPASLRPVVQIAAGGFHTCAVDNGGLLVCWGQDDEGQSAGFEP